MFQKPEHYISQDFTMNQTLMNTTYAKRVSEEF